MVRKVREFLTRGTLKVTGTERRSWLNGLLTCDVNLAREGQAVRGLLLDRLGKIQSDVWVVESGDTLLLSLSPGTAAAVQQELERRLIMEEAELADVSAELTWYFLATELSSAALEMGVAGAAPAGSEGAVVATLALLKGLPGCVAALPRRSNLPKAWELWSDSEWGFARIQGGYAEFGQDFGLADRPHEAALDRLAVSWNKGCYLGQEVVCMQDMRGKVKHSLRSFAFRGAGPVPSKTVLLRADNGAKVGEVTSAARALENDEWLILARVQLEALGSSETGLVLEGHSEALTLA
jgi:folate-binding protein YgfZ